MQREPVLRQFSRECVPGEGGSLSPRSRRADYVIEDHGYETPCWIWQKTINAAGYGTGSFRGAGFGTNYAHRAYYMLAVGPVPDGWHVHHKCEVHPCVNPAHLEAKSHGQHLTEHKQAESDLSWDDVRTIRARAHAGETINALADEYGMSLGTMSPLLAGRTWVDPDYQPPEWQGECPQCGETFTARRTNQRFCSLAHMRRWNALRRARRAAGTDPDAPVRSYTRRAA